MEKTYSKYLEVSQVAKHLGKSEGTIYNWIKEGRLRAIKNGKSYKINPADVIEISTVQKRIDRYKVFFDSSKVVNNELDVILNQKTKEIIQDILLMAGRIGKFLDEMEKSNQTDIEVVLADWKAYDKKCREMLLDFRTNIESFYKAFDIMEGMVELEKYANSNKVTLDHELERVRKIRNNEKVEKSKGLRAHELFKDI